MDDKHKKRMRGAFFYEKEDGTISDIGLHDDLLSEEVRIRQELIDAGVIKEVIMENKKQNKT
jgi:hypothetical protein